MTTATAPRIISDNLKVITGTHDYITATHDYDTARFMNVDARHSDRVYIHIRDGREYAGMFVDREDARAFAQAILDATA